MKLRSLIIPSILLLGSSTMSGTVTRDEAMDFLYSSMSLPDSADYPRAFYLANVDLSLKARADMPWGATVPDREFKHFVLPVRVNNEALDNSRLAFYDALRDRVKSLSMKDAILEVNRWCHEHVTYRPSDSRTSSPLSAVSQAIGRCGEESTFTVAALRSVGIPARQIYTPRWAHTDDNHAWVEAWADGKWYFLGACEPEPVLNLAWFNAPASRGLLMNTNVTGDYRGPEEVFDRQPLSTRINVTSNYAPVATLPVEVVNADGTPAAGAKVAFCIYNYAEYFPTVVKTADASGHASILGGLGDFIVWATDGENFGVAKGSPRDYAADKSAPAPLRVVLDKNLSWTGAFDMDIVPPPVRSSLPEVTPAQRAENDRRVQREDSIRMAYTSTFLDVDSARWHAWRLALDEDKMIKVLTESRGNHAVLLHTFFSLPDFPRRRALDLLCNVSEKDRRDITPDVIFDNIRYTPVYDPSCGYSKDDYDRYILSPRIEIEYLRPWRGELSEIFTAPEAARFRSDPTALVAWVEDNITLADDRNPQRLRMSPAAVARTRKADSRSRDIFFVALARTLGIPARIDQVSGAPQYMLPSGKWSTVKLASGTSAPETNVVTGRLALDIAPDLRVSDPVYYSRFSISRIDGGLPVQLEFDEGPVSKVFADPVDIEAGQYILTSGQRMADGSVLARSEIFTVPGGQTVTVPLVVRQPSAEDALPVIGSVNAENRYRDIVTGEEKSILSTTGRGYYILGFISPGHEPSIHALNDLAAVAQRIDASGRKAVLLLDNDDKASRLDRSLLAPLPAGTAVGVDIDGASRGEVVESLHLPAGNGNDPIFVIADTFNRIVWVSSGYTIGLGEALLRALDTLD